MPHPLSVTTPSDREIVVTRTFDAPARRVFEAHTVPSLVQQWLVGPPGWSMPVCEIDLRPGGAYRYVWRSDDGKNEFGASGTYSEVTAPTRIVSSERLEGISGADTETVCTLELSERDGTTTLTQTMRFASPEIRDTALKSGMTRGMGQSYDRLDGVLP